VSEEENFGRDLSAGLDRRRLEQTTLVRDVTAVRIPEGDRVALERDTEVTIVQSADGAYTIQVPLLGTMCRIGPDDVDALGKRLQERAKSQDPLEAQGQETPTSLHKQIEAQLARVYDPELPLSIVDLGLIYDLRISETDVAVYRVDIQMTLTTQACGMGPTIAREVRERLGDLPRVGDIAIEIVWEPQWTPHRISPEGRKKLGLD
jgi:probable FeS assembly SUF system protein SufT